MNAPMLDIMRRHASGWAIRILLGFIGISFALFFGFSAYRGRSMGNEVAAMVEDEVISNRQYSQSYDAALERLGKNMTEGVPDNMRDFLRSNVLEQLIMRKARGLYAYSLGFRVADSEVARIIRSQEQLRRDGVFDMQYYRERFRPYYRKRFGIDYEEALREDILLDIFESFVGMGLIASPEESEWRKTVSQQVWQFQVIEVPPTAKEVFSASENPDEALRSELARWLSEWQTGPVAKADLDKLKATIRKEVALTLFERNQLLNRPLPDEYARPLFSLAPGSVHPEPIHLTGTWYLVKLESKKKSDASEATDPGILAREIFFVWFNDFRQQLEIKTNIQL